MKFSKIIKFLLFSKSFKILRSPKGRKLAKTIVKSGMKIKRMK